MSDNTFTVRLSPESGFRMRATPVREGAPTLVVDEPPPLGEGAGATPTELLAAAVGGCLTASLMFCAGKARVPVDGLHAQVEGSLIRNEAGRLRVGGLRVTLELELPAGEAGRADRCLDLFEDFCIVKESVRTGIPVEVEVVRREGAGAATTGSTRTLGEKVDRPGRD